MAKTNWQMDDTVLPADMNDIGQEINGLRNDVDNINILPASLTVAGITKLSNETNGTRENVAATEKAVNDAIAQADLNAKSYTDGKLNAVPITTALKPGTSVITTDQAAVPTFKLWGNTLVNLLGADGNFETDSNNDGVADGWTKAGTVTVTQDSTITRYGTKSTKMVIGSNGRQFSNALTFEPNKKYVAIADAYISAFAVGTVTFRLLHPDSGSEGMPSANFESTLLNQWQTRFMKVPAGVASAQLYLGRYASTTDHTVNFDGVGVYEVSDELYNRLGVDITETNIREFLPHVDGKQHVQGVGITKQGENLLPGEPYDYNEGSGSTGKPNTWIDGKLAIYNGSGNVHGRGIWVDVVPGQVYKLSLKGVRTGDNKQPRVLIGYSSTTVEVRDTSITLPSHSITTVTFTPTQSRILIRFLINGTSTTSDPAYVYDMMLVAGDVVPNSYVPAEPQRLILPVTLASVGNVRDELTVKGNEAQLIKRVERNFVIDGNVSAPSFAAGTGFKAITMTLNNKALYGQTINAIRYDNFIFRSRESAASAGNVYTISTGTTLVITEENAVTGWVDAVNPNVSAIRALLNGWKATANDGTRYTGWVSLLTGAAPSTNTEAYVANNKAPGWTVFATVDYVLATPEVKTVQVEGGITLHPGGNQISVATGIIQREKVTPTLTGEGYYINAGSSILKNRTNAILNVYKGANADPVWAFGARNSTDPNSVPRGPAYALAKTADVDPKADYYVTYMALDKYNVSANITQVEVQYARGLSGLASELAKAAADGYETDSRQDFELMYNKAYGENLRYDVNNSIGYGATTNSGSAYAVTLAPVPSSLIPGLRVTVKINAASTGAPTLNVNGLGSKSILKANGNAASLKANGVYTLVYDGTAFILQGEGGAEGNVTADKVLSGTTYTDPITGDLKSGTMANQGALVLTPATSNVTIPAGYHNGSGYVKAYTPGVKYATGTATSGDDDTTFFDASGSGIFNAYVSVSVNLDFVPSRIILVPTSEQSRASKGSFYNADRVISGFKIVSDDTADFRVDDVRAYVRNTGFFLPAASYRTNYTWYAYE